MIGATGEPARDVLSKIVKALTGARVSYRLLSIPQGKGGTDYLLSMQYAGSAPWAKSAFEITGFPFGETRCPTRLLQLPATLFARLRR
jgi:hypothetical protein